VRLLVDLTAAQPTSGRYHGGGEYTKAVFYALLNKARPGRLGAFYSQAEWLDPTVEAAAKRAGLDLLPVNGRSELQDLVWSGRFDRLYSALPYRYHDLDVSRLEFFFTIHGLRPLEMPTDGYETRYGHGFRKWSRAILKRTVAGLYLARRRQEFRRLLEIRAQRTLVIVPSMHTRYALLSQFPDLDPASIRVFYSPAKPASEPPTPEAVEKLLRSLEVSPRGYFLLVSSNRWVKNAIRAIEALDRLFNAGPALPHKVVVLGADPACKLGVRPRNAHRFSYRGYVESWQLEALYSQAYCLLFPTLNEGFGYPPLEAMRFGTPVICSAIASTTEICEDAAIYVNPFSVDEIHNRSLMLASEPRIWDRYAARGRRRAQEIGQAQDRMLRELVDLLLAPSPPSPSVPGGARASEAASGALRRSRG
jgi:glycosyltransferase involved in cell wall biosynthesis